MTLHIGRGTTRGAMTVFPLWSAEGGPDRYTLDPRHLVVSEMHDGPDVGRLMVGNAGDKAVLVLEGQLFEGGWQHRMATRPVMVGAGQRIAVEVACVEQGRWGGGRAQRTVGRRATPYIREAVRGHADVQGEVWERVARHTAGTDNPTTSFVRHLDERTASVDWSDYRLLPGQSGVLIGVGGQPYVGEVFSSQRRLRVQLDAILRAAALDAWHAPGVPTPGRRARRFVDRFEAAALGDRRPAGEAEEIAGRTPYVDASTLRWQGRDVHSRMTNVRHPMLVAG
ncbi:ARPP-1 family domain-containing protein [Nocardioides solisilvae]|uniref:ARPP-1 family domain-containing protein n=1 Tax=Nocardioides solisilvae TaxID=1542435 RepID=UPI000D741933|nr:DUF6569 family protein [Nocardioides solisilvae]